MVERYAYFLTLVEEGNFSRAAGRLFISQQALSDHIRRLEKRYGVLLFERRPQLRLTPAGEAMARRFRQLDVIESALQSELGELAGGERGCLRLGMSIPRAKILAPALLREFCARFPHVSVIIEHEETHNLERMLRAGEIDLFFGTDPQPDPEFQAVRLMDEPTLMVASRRLLEREFPGPEPLERWKREGADLPLCVARLPFILNSPVSRLRRQAEEFLGRSGASIDPVLTISDNETQLLIAAQDVGACFVPLMMAHHIAQINASQPENPLLAFRIAGLKQAARLELVHLRECHLPRYTRALIALLQRQTAEIAAREP